jgi:hypothetical protein
MAALNLLKADFTGTVGSVYGAKWKGKSLIKSRPFGKSPPTVKQNNAVRAFECVNRVGVIFAKIWWPYLGLTDKTMLKHNAVARILRPMLEGGIFRPLAFVDAIPSDEKIRLQPPTQEASGAEVYATLTVDPDFSVPSGAQIHALVIDSAGYSGVPATVPFTTSPIALAPKYPQERALFVLLFVSVPEGKGYILTGSNAGRVVGPQRTEAASAPRLERQSSLLHKPRML